MQYAALRGRYGRSGPVVVLIHGWSASRHYFDRNARALAKTCQVGGILGGWEDVLWKF